MSVKHKKGHINQNRVDPKCNIPEDVNLDKKKIIKEDVCMKFYDETKPTIH